MHTNKTLSLVLPPESLVISSLALEGLSLLFSGGNDMATKIQSIVFCDYDYYLHLVQRK